MNNIKSWIDKCWYEYSKYASPSLHETKIKLEVRGYKPQFITKIIKGCSIFPPVGIISSTVDFKGAYFNSKSSYAKSNEIMIILGYNLSYSIFLEVMIHEYIHYIDDSRTNGKCFNIKRIRQNNRDINLYYNDTTEINAYIVGYVNNPSKSTDKWFDNLTIKNKKKVLGRIHTGRYYKIN